MVAMRACVLASQAVETAEPKDGEVLVKARRVALEGARGAGERGGGGLAGASSSLPDLNLAQGPEGPCRGLLQP